MGRLVRTSVSLHEAEQEWLNHLAERGRAAGVRRPTKDFVARALIRAVIELEPEIELDGITLDREEELVRRIMAALAICS